MNPLISIIVPVYQAEAFLSQCLDSLCSQTYANLEIILVNDGSRDNSGKICDAYAEKDPRIKVIHTSNGGVSAARNAGLELITGQYLTFVDSDDYISPDAVEVLLERIKADGTDLAVGQVVKVDDQGVQLTANYSWMTDTVMTREEAFRHLGSEKEFPCYACCKLYRRGVFDGIRFPALTCGEDLWVWPLVLDRCEKISVLSRVVYSYLQHSSSAVHTKRDAQILDSMEAALHSARFLLSKEMRENAGVYFTSAVYQAMELKDKSAGKKLLTEAFTREERKKLLKKDVRSYFRWISIYMPWLYDAVVRVKRIFGR